MTTDHKMTDGPTEDVCRAVGRDVARLSVTSDSLVRILVVPWSPPRPVLSCSGSQRTRMTSVPAGSVPRRTHMRRTVYPFSDMYLPPPQPVATWKRGEIARSATGSIGFDYFRIYLAPLSPVATPRSTVQRWANLTMSELVPICNFRPGTGWRLFAAHLHYQIHRHNAATDGLPGKQSELRTVGTMRITMPARSSVMG